MSNHENGRKEVIEPGYLNQTQAAKYCGVGRDVFRYEIAVNVPHKPVGRLNIYSKKDLNEFMATGLKIFKSPGEN